MKKSSDQKNQDPTTTPSPAFVVTRERFFVDEREHDDGVRTPLLEPSPATSTSAINDEQKFNLTPFLRFATRYLLFSTFTSVHQKSSDLMLDLRKSSPPSSAIHAPSPNLIDGTVPVAKSTSTTAFIKPRHLNSNDDDYDATNDNTSTNVLEQKAQATFIRTALTTTTTRISQSMKDSKKHKEHSNSAGAMSTPTDEQEEEVLLHKRARAARMDENEKLKKDLQQVKSFFRFSLFALQEFKRKIL